MPWFKCELKAAQIYKQVTGRLKPFSFKYTVSLEADILEVAEITALKMIKLRAFETQHAKLLDQVQLGIGEVLNITGPFDKPEFPLGTEAIWSTMSENYLS